MFPVSLSPCSCLCLGLGLGPCEFGVPCPLSLIQEIFIKSPLCARDMYKAKDVLVFFSTNVETYAK